MRITLDLSELVARGALSVAEADRLKALALRDTGALGSNVLLAFGAVAVALGAGVMLPTAETVLLIGVVFFGVGLALRVGNQSRWDVFAQICMVVGALAIVGGVWAKTNGGMESQIALALGLAGAAFAARSGLLAALAVLMLSAALGSGTAYWFATYGVWVNRPGITIGVLAVVALGLYLLSLRAPHQYERLAIIGARTAILVMNIAFLVGSLFGDGELKLDKLYFSVGWAVALLAVALWAVRANRRWVVNMAAVFGALHFYTQWFEVLGASPLSILGGGMVLIGLGLGLRAFNRPPTPAGAPVPPVEGLANGPSNH